MIDGFIINDNVLEEYILRETIVKVPDGVKVIGKGAFKGHASIEEIILPDTVTDIMDTAFKGCRKLHTINFPEGLISIGEYAFHRCHSLKSIKLPMGLKKIDNCAFLYCDELEYVSIPGVEQLGLQAFSNDVSIKHIEVSNQLELSSICDVFTGCSNISEIRLSDGSKFSINNIIETISSKSTVNPIVKAIATDIYRTMSIEDDTLVKFLINVKDVTIPMGITRIAKSCFFDKKGIVSVKLPETLTKIESRAFRNCINLERVEFTSNNVDIDKDAFKNCTTLKYITLADGVTYEIKGGINTNKELPEIVNMIHSQILGNFFISGTTLLKYRGNEERVVIPEGITIIGEKAFAGNEAIGRVILPESIKEIREKAFMDCLLLQTIELKEGIEHIGKSAFENCVKLLAINIPESINKIEKSVFNRCKNLKEVSIGTNVKGIDNLAFYGCTSLKQLSLPEGLESIGDMAFYKCTGLKDIILPENIVKLGSNVFTASGLNSATVNCNLKQCGMDVLSQCNKLRKITFGKEVTSIGDKFAFGCKSLKYVDIPENIEQIGRNAFEGSAYINNVDKVIGNTFIDGSGLSGKVVIPEGVTIIAGGAFYNNANITSIELPNSIKKIGARAFCGCENLKEAVIPTGVTTLEEGVFSYCTGLESVRIKGEILKICDNAFYACSSLLNINTSKAKYIGKNAFNGCTKLRDLELNCIDIKEDAFRGTKLLDELKKESTLVVISNTVVDGSDCVGNVVIPNGVTSIAPYAFASNNSITSVDLPKIMTTIGEGAFSGCKNIEEVTLPYNLGVIGRKAFEKCTSITNVFGNAEYVKDNAFSYCIRLQSVRLFDTKSFGKEAFCGCEKLESVECRTVQYIGENCFSDCESLLDFNFDNIKYVGANAFSRCTSLKRLDFKGNTEICEHAFEDCGHVEEISLPDGNLKHGSYAFSGCTAIKSINIEGEKYNVDNYSVLLNESIPNSVKSLYNSAMGCFNIDEDLSLVGYENKGDCVNIPNGIKRIEREVFKDAMNIKELHIPDSVEYIGPRAFNNTMWLEEQTKDNSMVIVNGTLIDASKCSGHVIIPGHIKTIAGWAFANCYELTGVTFLAKTTVEEYAFRNCINLKKVITEDRNEYKLTKISDRDNEMLPQNVRNIFMDCLNCFKTEGDILVECTGNIDNLEVIDGIAKINDEVFKSSNLLTKIKLSDDTTIIGKNAFEDCKWLVSVNNANNIKKIGKRAFSGCSLLESIELSSNLQSIDFASFEYCESLKSIIIPEGITEIPEKAFYRCRSLKRVQLPSTLKTIGKEAFAFCNELESINIPDGIKTIDNRAFAWCSKLDEKYNSDNETLRVKLIGVVVM